MSKIQMVKNIVLKSTGRGVLLLKKHSPEILMAAGVVGVVTSTVLACKATLKVDEVMDEAKTKLDKIHAAKETLADAKNENGVVKYSDQDYKKDLLITYVQTGVEFTKLYGPSVLLGAASIGCILGSHNVMRKRNFALVAAYKTIEKSFSDYRKRVVAEFGADQDRKFKYGITTETETVTEVGEDGKKHKVKKTTETFNAEDVSGYARVFDRTCSTTWSNMPGYNLQFLKCQQNYFNDILRTQGHVFLNEVYDALGMERTPAGAIVGWVKNGGGDNEIDFGLGDFSDIKDPYNIIVDFNVDGPIWDLI